MGAVGRYVFHALTNMDFEMCGQQLQRTASWCVNQHQAWSRALKKGIFAVCSKVNSQSQTEQMCAA